MLTPFLSPSFSFLLPYTDPRTSFSNSSGQQNQPTLIPAILLVGSECQQRWRHLFFVVTVVIIIIIRRTWSGRGARGSASSGRNAIYGHDDGRRTCQILQAGGSKNLGGEGWEWKGGVRERGVGGTNEIFESDTNYFWSINAGIDQWTTIGSK